MNKATTALHTISIREGRTTEMIALLPELSLEELHKFNTIAGGVRKRLTYKSRDSMTKDDIVKAKNAGDLLVAIAKELDSRKAAMH